MYKAGVLSAVVSVLSHRPSNAVPFPARANCALLAQSPGTGRWLAGLRAGWLLLTTAVRSARLPDRVGLAAWDTPPAARRLVARPVRRLY